MRILTDDLSLSDFRHKDFMYTLCCRAEYIFAGDRPDSEKLEILETTIGSAIEALLSLQREYNGYCDTNGEFHERCIVVTKLEPIIPLPFNETQFNYSAFMMDLCQRADEIYRGDSDDRVNLCKLQKLLLMARQVCQDHIDDDPVMEEEWELNCA